MGCGGSKAASTAVLPSDIPMKPSALAVAPDIVTSGKIPRDTKSGKSNSSADSGLADSDVESTSSSPDEIDQPDGREMVVSPQTDAKGGCSFEIALDATPTRKRMPPRLKAIVQAPKRELTMLELHKQQQAATLRRNMELGEVRKKGADESKKVDLVANKFARELTTLGNEVDDKEARALENRKKHLTDMRNKLKAAEDKGQKVRNNKRMSSGKSNGSERALSGKSANSISSGRRA